MRPNSISRAATVVMHARFGDSRNRLSAAYYGRAISRIRDKLPVFSQPAIVRIQTNGVASEVRPILDLVKGPAVAGVVDYAQNTSLQLAFHRMVLADVLVMSRSSLSNAAALLSNGTIYFPACWASGRRPMPHWRLLPC